MYKLFLESAYRRSEEMIATDPEKHAARLLCGTWENGKRVPFVDDGDTLIESNNFGCFSRFYRNSLKLNPRKIREMRKVVSRNIMREITWSFCRENDAEIFLALEPRVEPYELFEKVREWPGAEVDNYKAAIWAMAVLCPGYANFGASFIPGRMIALKTYSGENTSVFVNSCIRGINWIADHKRQKVRARLQRLGNCEVGKIVEECNLYSDRRKTPVLVFSRKNGHEILDFDSLEENYGRR